MRKVSLCGGHSIPGETKARAGARHRHTQNSPVDCEAQIWTHLTKSQLQVQVRPWSKVLEWRLSSTIHPQHQQAAKPTAAREADTSKPHTQNHIHTHTNLSFIVSCQKIVGWWWAITSLRNRWQPNIAQARESNTEAFIKRT